MRLTLLALTLGAPTLGAQAPTTPPTPTVAPVSPPPALTPPAERPTRLLRAEALAFLAYPGLARVPVQTRVIETATGAAVTFGRAYPDARDLLALSRPREALLVIDAAFDGSDAITAATLRGVLAKGPERRKLRALAAGWSAALDADGAAFGPAQQAQFLRQLDLGPLRRSRSSLDV